MENNKKKSINWVLSDKDTYSLIVGALVIILLCTMAAVTGVRLQPLPEQGLPFVTEYYELAIDSTAKLGRIPDGFIKDNMKKSKFRLDYDNEVVSINKKNWSITLRDGIKVGSQTVVKVRKSNDIYAIANIRVVKADVIVSSAAEFLQLSNKNQTVILTEKLDFSSITGNVNEFSGKLFFNHYPIVGADASNFPLFNTLDNAQIIGATLNINISIDDERAQLINVSNTDNEDLAQVFGIIAAQAKRTSFESITLLGKLNLNIKDGDNNFRIGAIAGFLNDRRREREEDLKINASKNLRVYLDIEINSNTEHIGDIECGLVFGLIKNASLSTVVAQGNIDIFAKGSTLNRVSLGGVFGSLIKEYDAYGHDFSNFDTMDRLSSQVDIFIQITELANESRMGGIGAYAQNVNLTNCTTDMTVVKKYPTGASKNNKAPLIAKAENTLQGYNMTINGEDWSSFQ